MAQSGVEKNSIPLIREPSNLMHNIQIPNAAAIAKTIIVKVIKKFFHGVSYRTDFVFLPESFSTKNVEPFCFLFYDFLISLSLYSDAQIYLIVFYFLFQDSM